MSHPGGRPSKYDPKYCEELIAYFSHDWLAALGKDLDGRTVGKDIFVIPPMFSRFARKIDVHVDTLLEWKETHEEFSLAYKRAKVLQKEMIQECLISGVYSGAGAIFAAKNMTDMRDEQHIDHTTKGEKLDGGMTPEQMLIIKEMEERLKKSVI